MKDYYLLQHANLEADETTLTVRAAELRRIPVEQISGLHLLAGYTLTSGVTELAAEHSFPIHFYNYHGAYRGTFLPPPVNLTSGTLTRQVLAARDDSTRHERAREILEAAGEGMTTMLAPFGLNPPPLAPTHDLEALRLAEARVRKEYYALCDAVLPEYWSIVKRERRPPRRPADALLGYANGILYAKTTGWIHRAGLDPRIGFIHGDARAPNPLALDLAEILKPHVSEGALFSVAASGHERSLMTDVGEGVYLNEKGRKTVIRAMEDILATETKVRLFDRTLTVARIGELIPTKLHRALVTGERAAYPSVACTLSSSTMRTLNEGRSSVDSS